MKTVAATLVSIALLTFLSMMAGLKLDGKASAEPPGRPASVILQCAANDTDPALGNTILVYWASSSSNAPAISRGTDCAQAIAGLVGSGFEISSTEMQEYIVYTLIARTEKHGKDK